MAAPRKFTADTWESTVRDRDILENPESSRY